MINVFKEIIEQDDYILFPIYGSDSYCYMEAKDEELCIDIFKRFLREDYIIPYDRFKLPNDDNINIVYYFYEVYCAKTERKYILFTSLDFNSDDLSMGLDGVCLPYNYLNIIEIKRNYFFPFMKYLKENEDEYD